MSVMVTAAAVALVFARPIPTFAATDGSCVAKDSEASCRASISPSSLSSENLLLQSSIRKHRVTGSPNDMVNEDNGFEDGGLPEIPDTGCTPADVRRRRRQVEMCACRRRDSNRRYDGGWRCQNDRMVQEESTWTTPVWSDEFDGNGSVDESKWTIIDSGSGNGNNEKQWYTTRSDNVIIENGVLKIVGKPEEYGGKWYTSAKITTQGKGDFGPGHRIEVRARLPVGVGTWPAIWMLATDSNYGIWPASGEIDIMEAIGKSRGKVFGTIHTDAYNHMKNTQKGKSFYTEFDEWHTYALDWEEDTLTWYTDGNEYNKFQPDNLNDYAQWPFNRRFYLILNLALGGNLGGSIKFNDDQIMEIDYVRIYCLDGSTTCETPPVSCCDSCPGKPFCSQKSGNCHDHKNSDYYDTCSV